jgi:hypothetical protein
MKLKLVIITILLSTLFACKKTEVKGTVYSKHNLPVMGASMSIYERVTRYSEPTKYNTITDINGNYYLSFKTKRNYIYILRCQSDSGEDNSYSIINKKTNVADFYLH